MCSLMTPETEFIPRPITCLHDSVGGGSSGDGGGRIFCGDVDRSSASLPPFVAGSWLLARPSPSPSAAVVIMENTVSSSPSFHEFSILGKVLRHTSATFCCYLTETRRLLSKTKGKQKEQLCAPCDSRLHDLWIMRPTRYQLSQRSGGTDRC